MLCLKAGRSECIFLFKVTLLFITWQKIGWSHLAAVTDFDNTIVESRREHGGTFVTPYVIYRISTRASTAEPDPQGPLEVHLSHKEFEDLTRRQALATGEGLPGTLAQQMTLELETGPDGRPLRIVPGNYTLRIPDSFRFFRSHGSENFLLRDYQKATTASSTPGQPLSWHGPFFRYLAEVLKDPKLVPRVQILSARGHHKKHWSEVFSTMVQQEFLPASPSLNHFHGLSHPDYDYLSRGLDLSVKVAQRKERFLTNLAIQLRSSIIDTESPQVLNPDGDGERGQFHTLLYADDDSEILERVLELFKRLARSGQYTSLKFILFNAGTKTEITDSHRPAILVVKSDGTFRPLASGELEDEISHLQGSQFFNLSSRSNRGCGDSLQANQAKKE